MTLKQMLPMRLVRLAYGTSGGTARQEPSTGIVGLFEAPFPYDSRKLGITGTVPTGGFDSHTTHANHQQIGEHHGRQQSRTS